MAKLCEGDLYYARHLVASSLKPSSTTKDVEELRHAAAISPAFGYPLRVLAGVLEHILAEAERVKLPTPEAIAEFAMHVRTDRPQQCGVVHRIAAEEYETPTERPPVV